MQLAPGVTINIGDPVTRQTIYDLLANATGGTVEASDLHPSVQTIISQVEPPTPHPGKIWYDREDCILKVYIDVLDGTGVSLWVAFAPDRFEIPLLASEDIPYGAAVQLTGIGRGAKLPPAPMSLAGLSYPLGIWEYWKVVGFQNSGRCSVRETAASGTWFSCAVDGLVWVWHPVNRGGKLTGVASYAGGNSWNSLISSWSGVTGPSGINNLAGGLVRTEYVLQDKYHIALTLGTTQFSAWNRNWSKEPFWGARIGRI